MAVLTTGAILTSGMALGKEALKKAFAALQPNLTAKTRRFVQGVLNDSKLSNLHGRLDQVRIVKTLAQLDRPVDLMTFYCDSHVYLRGKRTKVDSVADLPKNRCVLIQGIAGQGKSIFLRYLCSVELMKGDLVPIFVELRKLDAGESLIKFLIRSLSEYDIKLDELMLLDLIKSGKFLLLLDAFDELREDAKLAISVEVDILATKMPLMRMIITSRPNSGLESSPRVTVTKLSNLEEDEYCSVIRKVSQDLETAEQLISQILSHQGEIKQLLITPLLVTLLVIQFKSYQVLPDQLSEFYDSLLQVLLQRHDGIKLGYKRSRLSRLNDQQFRLTFEAFCFQGKGRKFSVLTETAVYKLAEVAIRKMSLKEEAASFVGDVVGITCLLVKDGVEYRFIHKSVQEYYAASYINQLSETLSLELYKKLFSVGTWSVFRQELSFLKEIGTYRYYKHGALLFLCTLLSTVESDFLLPPLERHYASVERMLSECVVSYTSFDDKNYLNSMQMIQIGPLSFKGMAEVYNTLIHAFALLTRPDAMLITGEGKVNSSSVGDLVARGYIGRNTMNTVVAKFTLGLFKVGKEAAEYTRKHEEINLISIVDDVFLEE